jgi:hypothetical protein
MAIMSSGILACERTAISYSGAVSDIRPELPEKRFYDVCFYRLEMATTERQEEKT